MTTTTFWSARACAHASSNRNQEQIERIAIGKLNEEKEQIKLRCQEAKTQFLDGLTLEFATSGWCKKAIISGAIKLPYQTTPAGPHQTQVHGMHAL